MKQPAVWFKRAVWLGILADWVLAGPTIFAPQWVLDLIGLRSTGDVVWTGFASLLVFLLSLFYIPGANDPYRYRFNAWLAVVARGAGVVFFFLLRPGYYAAFGVVDLTLFLLQLPLLLLALRQAPAKVEVPAPGAPQAPVSDRSAVWFKRALWLGILADWVLGVPSIFAPEWVLELTGLRPTGDPFWSSFAALILILLSLGYIPGANQPYRYRVNAWLGVLARPPGVFFFFLLYPGAYPLFGLLDLGLVLLQLPLLLKAMQARPELGPELDRDIRPYNGATFREVKDGAWSGEYDELPYHKSVGPLRAIQFLNDSARNLHDRRDLRPTYTKLIHAHGVCYAGLWKIDQDSPYTGYFAKGSQGLLVARASVAGFFLRRGTRRSFGIAGKVFPTLDPDERVWPGNFVTVSHLSGSRAKHITDIEMTNFPTVGWSPAANLINRVFFRLVDTRPGYRQLFPISTLGVPPGAPVVTPDLLLLKVDESMPKIDASDFRDEIRLKHYPDHKLVYGIWVKNFEDTDWTRLGSLEFTEDVVSEGSDKRLHFWIPRDVPTLPKQRPSTASGGGL